MSVARPALAGSPPPRGPSLTSTPAMPRVLWRVAAAAFLLSSILVALSAAVAAFPDLFPDSLLFPARPWAIRFVIASSTTCGLTVTWMLPTRSIFGWLSVLGSGLYLWQVLSWLHAVPPWPAALSLLALGYLALALITNGALLAGKVWFAPAR